MECPRESKNTRRARPYDSEFRDVSYAGFGNARGERRESCKLWKRRPDFLTKRFGETACDRRGGFHCDLLSENRANSHFETVKRAGHTQTGILRHAFLQKLIFHQMRRDQIRPGREVEQVAQPA